MSELDELSLDSHYEKILHAKDFEIYRLKQEIQTLKDKNVASASPAIDHDPNLQSSSPLLATSSSSSAESPPSVQDDMILGCTPSLCNCPNGHQNNDSDENSDQVQTPINIPVPTIRISAGVPKYRRTVLPSSPDASTSKKSLRRNLLIVVSSL